ncbi:MAG: hydroxymethylglutaryl-CoA lyase [Alphaproteobacteria bacterium]|nr:MAG: hydroxymethylglutaryl-CoA lyase [Alphaproteobacteria bacterium]
MAFPRSIQIVDVTARDGLQNEDKIVAAADKISLIHHLNDCGFSHIEVGSFVGPALKQMADSDVVFAGIDKKPGVRYSVLVPNMKGMGRAVSAGVKTIAVFLAASETFSQKNINCSIAESLERLNPVMEAAKANKIDVRGYVSCVMGCPFEGDIAPAKVAEVSDALYQMGVYEISLGDTIGVGTPDKTKALLDTITPKIPGSKLAMHCHDTYGHAIDNIEIALRDYGIRVVDSAIAGIGGCPYAKSAAGTRAPGNVATEKVLQFASRNGIQTDVNPVAVAKAAAHIQMMLKK